MKKPKKVKTGQDLKKILWKYFSEFIRRRDADWKGMATCCSCGCVKHWKEMQAGHYRPRTDGLSTFFLEKNVHTQCSQCNKWKHGNLAPYSIYLKRRYGDQILEELDYATKQKITISVPEYLRLIDFYKQKIKQFDD